MGLMTLFAIEKPTTDEVAISSGHFYLKDTVLYRDSECKDLVCRWPWYYTDRPKPGQKTTTVNCYRWKLQWQA